MYEKSGIKSRGEESEECELNKSSCHYLEERLTTWELCSHQPSPKITIFNSNFTSFSLHTHNRSNRIHIFYTRTFSTSAPCGFDLIKRRKKIQQQKKQEAKKRRFKMLIQKAFRDHRRRRSTANDLESNKSCPCGAFETFLAISTVILVTLIGGATIYLAKRSEWHNKKNL